MTKVPWRSTWRDKGLISAQGFRGFISIMEGKMWWWGGLEEDPPSWLTKKQRENRLELEAAKNLQRPLPTDLLPPTRLCLLKAPGNRHSNHEATETTQIQTVSASHERHPGPTHCILVPFFKALIYNRVWNHMKTAREGTQPYIFIPNTMRAVWFPFLLFDYLLKMEIKVTVGFLYFQS